MSGVSSLPYERSYERALREISSQRCNRSSVSLLMDETAEVWQDRSAVDFNCHSTRIDVGAMNGVFSGAKAEEDV